MYRLWLKKKKKKIERRNLFLLFLITMDTILERWTRYLERKSDFCESSESILIVSFRVLYKTHQFKKKKKYPFSSNGKMNPTIDLLIEIDRSLFEFSKKKKKESDPTHLVDDLRQVVQTYVVNGVPGTKGKRNVKSSSRKSFA